MKVRTQASGLAVVAIAVIWASITFAQDVRWRGGGGWGPDGRYGRLYDVKTVETVSGRVTKVEEIVPHKRMGRGVHLFLETDTGSIAVHLGPAWFIERQDTTITTGDEVEVKGSRVTYEDKPVIIAAELRKGDQVLRLRDASGTPVWSGWRRRR
jgi:hypothetical protein